MAEAIDGAGLADFYQYREHTNDKVSETQDDYSLLDLAEVQREFVRPCGEGAAAMVHIEGLTCAACVWLIEKRLATYPGVGPVRINAANHSGEIRFDTQRIKLSEIAAALASIGYDIKPMIARRQREQWSQSQKQDLMRLGVAGIGMMQAGMMAVALYAGAWDGIEDQWQRLLRWVSLVIATPVVGYSARPFFTAAWRSLKLGHLVMDVPVALALSLAYGASVYATLTNTGEVYFDSVAMFTFFLLLGRYLEKRTRYRNFLESTRYAQMLPLSAERLEHGQWCQVALSRLLPGDRVRVHAGAVFPCDGQVLDGISEAVEAVMTGESEPVAKAPGDRVIAGSYNGSSPLEVEVLATGGDTQLATIERMVEQASAARPKQVALADRIAAKFVAAVLLISAFTALVWLQREPEHALWVVLSVLVVTCPCALSLATPAVLTSGVNCLRRAGVLITGAQVLETLVHTRHVVLDKTGTLTEGNLHIQSVVLLAADLTQERALMLAAALEKGSHHPIAKAFESVADELSVTARSTQVGGGVSGDIEGIRYRLGTPEFALPDAPCERPGDGQWLLLVGAEMPLAWIHLHDRVRSSAQAAIAYLHRRDCQIHMLSGDRERSVSALARQLGIDHWRSRLLPADKLDYVKSLQAQGDTVLMVGDGINDVPVLSLADIAVAMGGAAELTRVRADCLLLNEDLHALAMLFELAARVKRTIRQNLTWAVGYNLLALPAAVMGWIPPWLAAIGMSSSSLIVVLNAIRVGRTPPTTESA